MRLVCVAVLLALASPAAARMQRVMPPYTLAPLTWDMTTEAAEAALERSKMEPKDAETRRYMAMTKDQPWVRHTTEPGYAFTPRKGWHGLVHFNWDDAAKDYRMDRVNEWTEGLSDGALKDELAALASTYGTPVETTPNQHVWRRSGSTLSASFGQDVSKRWTLSVSLWRQP